MTKTMLSLDDLRKEATVVDRPSLITEVTKVPMTGEFVPLIQSRTLSRHIYLTERGVEVKIGIDDGRKFGCWLRDMKRNNWEIGSRYDPVKKVWAVERKYFHVVNEWLLMHTDEMPLDNENIIPVGKIVRWRNLSDMATQTSEADLQEQVVLKKRRILKMR